MPIRKTIEQIPEFLPAGRSVLATLDPMDFDLDKDLQALKKVMIKPTYRNCEEAFWNDSISTSFTDITAAVVIGDGPRIRCDKNEEVIKIIKNWNRSINVNRKSVEDWIRETWFDAVVYGKFFWRVDSSTIFDNVDIQRLDPKTIEIFKDPVMGYRKFIQHSLKYKYHRTKGEFYRKAGKQKYTRPGSDWEIDKSTINYGESTDTVATHIHIPDEPQRMIFGDFFWKAPISNALHFIVYKRWILWFMRKYSQKHWAPFVILKVGDPRATNYPTQKHIMQAALDNGKNFIRQITNFGGVSIPGEMDIKTLETGTAKSSEIYVVYVRELDKQIMYSIFGSMGQREASGNELATSRTLQEVWLRFVKGVRRMYEILLTTFYSRVLLPHHGIIIEPEDLEIDWSSLRFESSQEVLSSIKIGAEVGLWKDLNEMRKAGQQVYSFMDPVPENENRKGEDIVPQKKAEGTAKERLMEYNKSRQKQ